MRLSILIVFELMVPVTSFSIFTGSIIFGVVTQTE